MPRKKNSKKTSKKKSSSSKRGISKPWRSLTAMSSAERMVMPARCFLGEDRRYPVCMMNTTMPACKGLRAAHARAVSQGEYDIARKATLLGLSLQCDQDHISKKNDKRLYKQSREKASKKRSKTAVHLTKEGLVQEKQKLKDHNNRLMNVSGLHHLGGKAVPFKSSPKKKPKPDF